MHVASRGEDEPEYSPEEDGELAEDPGCVKGVDEGGQEKKVEDKGGVLVGLTQKLRHKEDTKHHARDQGRNKTNDLARVAHGLVGWLEGRMGYSDAARGAAANAVAAAAVGTAAAVTGT